VSVRPRTEVIFASKPPGVCVPARAAMTSPGFSIGALLSTMVSVLPDWVTDVTADAATGFVVAGMRV